MQPILALVSGVLASAFCLAAASAQLRASAGDPPKLSGSTVSGTVVKLAGSAPIKSATVRLESTDDHSRIFSGTTDVSGRFELSGIDPGRYRLRVSRNGFVTSEYGQRSPNDPGAVLALSAGQSVKDLLFRLVPSAVISGRIQDEEGNPLPWVWVNALRETYVRGRRRLASEVTVVTNDLGEYRLFGLRPGRYFIYATYKPGQRLDPNEANDDSANSVKSGYVPMYYPGSPDPAKATAVTVKTGEEITSADFLLEPAAVYSIRGHASALGARRPIDGATLTLEPRTSTNWLWNSQTKQALVGQDGNFEIPDVLPGSYNLFASWMEEGRRYQARQSVDITTGDADGANLVLAPGSNIPGQIVWDGKPPTDKGSIAINIRSVNTTVVVAQTVRTAISGPFFLHEIPEGTYEVNVFSPSPDSYLKSIRFSGLEVSDNQFNVIRGAQATLEISMSTLGAHIQGSVVDEDGLPASGVWVVLVPAGAHRGEFRLFSQATTDQYGKFLMRGLPPGDYTLFSWEHVERNAWQDPEFLKEFEAKGQGISLQEADGKSVQLVAIRTASQDQEK